jgi:hypothetical protein
MRFLSFSTADEKKEGSGLMVESINIFNFTANVVVQCLTLPVVIGLFKKFYNAI